MNKKLFVACLAIAAFAVMPSLASAKPVLTHPTGTVLNVGASTCTEKAGICILGTNVGNSTLVTSTGTLTCTTVSMTGRLTANTTVGGAKGQIESATFGGTGGTAAGEPAPECTGSNFFTPATSITPSQSLPWCLETGEGDTATLKGGTCGAQTSINFKLAVTGVGSCEYTRAATVNATVQTDGEGVAETQNTIGISEVPWTLVSGPGLCPGEGKLSMRLKLETDVDASYLPIFISS
jgi:hypothetical protein